MPFFGPLKDLCSIGYSIPLLLHQSNPWSTLQQHNRQYRPVNPILSTFLPKHLLRPEKALIMAIHRQVFYRIFSLNERSWTCLKTFKGWCNLTKKQSDPRVRIDRKTFIFLSSKRYSRSQWQGSQILTWWGWTSKAELIYISQGHCLLTVALTLYNSELDSLILDTLCKVHLFCEHLKHRWIDTSQMVCDAGCKVDLSWY